MAIPETFALTVTSPGVVPVTGATVNHVNPLAVAVKVVPVLPSTWSVSCSISEPPAARLNDKDAGLTVSPPDAGLTVNATGTDTVIPLPTSMIVPVKVPAARPVKLEDTVSVAGVVPVDGDTVSHGAPLTVATNVVFGVAARERVCEAGLAPPAVAEKVSEAGLTVNVADGFTVNATGMVRVMVLPVIVIVPVRVPAESPDTLDDTVSVAGVVPVDGDTVSHGAPLTEAMNVVFGVAARERVCEAGLVPPAVAEKVSEAGLTVNVAAGFTVNETGMVRVIELPVMVIVPIRVPAESPDTLDDTVSVAGVVPVDGDTVSHGAPLTEAMNVVFGVAARERVCEAGLAPPAVAEKVSEAGLTVNVADGFTVNETGMVRVIELPVMVIVPIRVPAESPDTLEDTVSVAGVVPVDGDTVSHGAPLTEATNVVFGVAARERVCEAGLAPPAVAEKVSEAGLTVNVADGFTVNETGMVRVIELPVMVIVPIRVPAESPDTLEDTVSVAGVVPVDGDTVSHGAPLTEAMNVVFGVAARERVCEAGLVPPAVAEKVSEAGLTVNVAAGFTVNETGMVRVIELPVMVIVPIRVPAESPDTLEDTVSVAGVVPVDGDTVSHGAPLTEAMNVVFGVAARERVCEAGLVPPAVAEKVSEAGLTFRLPVAAVIVSVTGILS